MMPPPFDLAATPLEKGTTCLEASAGTGKTFTIAGLVVRLVAEQGLSLPRILVVTFTEAATDELRTRVRAALVEARDLLAGVEPEDPPPHLTALADVDESLRTERLQRIDAALEQFDQSAILTIHGFCRRILNRTALESGTPFGFETVPDSGRILERAFARFWREIAFEADPLTAGYLFTSHAHERLQKDAGLMLQTRDARLLPEPESADAVKSRLDQQIAELRESFDVTELANVLDACTFNDKALAACGWVESRERTEAFLQSIRSELADPSPSVVVDLRALRDLVEKSGFLGQRSKAAKAAKAALEEHPVMAQLGAVFETFEAGVHRLRGELQSALPTLLDEQKSQRQQLSFDDLLLRVRDAVRDPDSPTTRVIRSDYGAALIDEFQDTDPVQWEIFHTAFGHEDASLFLIGDPKQAIYGFRGADLGTYVDAVKTADRSYTLDRNWRSSESMVRAVDALFASHRWPFLGDIEYHSVQPAKGPMPLNGPAGQSALHFVLVKGEGSGSKAETRSAVQVVSQLLAESRIDERALDPDDCAVLCRSRAQVLSIREELEALGIPTRSQGGGDVLESDLCDELVAMARAMAHPRRAGIARRLWASVLVGRNADDLQQLSQDESTFEREIRILEQAREAWERLGFAAACELLFAHYRTRPRIAREPNASRHLTDLDHLVELFSASEVTNRADGEALARDVARERDGEDRAPEERLLRSDGEAGVQVLTMHASKGLEFEVCVVPFLDAGGPKPNQRQLRRSRDERGPRLEPAQDERESASRAELDSLAESVRLAYVALTRAKRRTIVLASARSLSKARQTKLDAGEVLPGGSALAHLYTDREIVPGDAPTSATRKEIWEARGPDAADLRGRLAEDLGRRFEDLEAPAGLISFGLAENLPEPVERTRETIALVERSSSRGQNAPAPWRRSSFTAITMAAAHDRPGVDLLEAQDRDETVEETEVAEPEITRPPQGIHAFASGAAAGLCLHELLERVPLFEDEEIDTDLVREILARHGLESPERHRIERGARQEYDPVATAVDLVESVRRMQLPGPDSAVTLNEAEDAANEWRFVLQGGVSGTEAELVRALGRSLPDPDDAFARTVESLRLRTGHSLRGYLSGAIDRVIRIGDAWLVVDWKSNRLGNDASVYRGEALTDAMVEHAYPLQAALYELALHRFLRRRLPDYDPARHLAGSLYVFLRGLDAKSKNSGLWYAPADVARLDALDAILGHTEGRRP